MTECPECGKTATSFVRTVCKSCYLRHWRAGTTDVLPVTDRKRDFSTRTERVCPKCQTMKALDAYPVSKTRSDGRAGWCRACYAKNRADKGLAHWREYELRRKYGIGLAEYDAMFTAQDGGCAMCGTTTNPDGGSLAVDHCHNTGRVRGLLCGPCNKALGLLRDDPRLLRKAVTYLEAG